MSLETVKKPIMKIVHEFSSAVITIVFPVCSYPLGHVRTVFGSGVVLEWETVTGKCLSRTRLSWNPFNWNMRFQFSSYIIIWCCVQFETSYKWECLHDACGKFLLKGILPLDDPFDGTYDLNFQNISSYDVELCLKHHINGSACMTLLENSIGFVNLKEFSLSMTPPIEHTTSTFNIYHHMTLSSVWNII